MKARQKRTASPEALRLAECLRRRLAEEIEGPLRVVLFGSHARGQAGPHSDIDVLVVVKALSRDLEDRIFEAAWQVGFDAGQVVSAVPASFDELKLLGASPFFRAVEAEGIAV